MRRCALHGFVYLWDLNTTTKTIAENTKKDRIVEQEVTMLANLKSSDTDNFNMNLGCHKVSPVLRVTFALQGVGLVVCGDDKGSLCLYHLPAMAQASHAPAPGTTQATTRLM
jgi:hypothetical protein